MNVKSTPWYQNTHLWGQVNLTENDPKECDLSVWRAYWKRTETEGIIINCGGIVSYYQSRFRYQYRAAFLGDVDYFKIWNDAARAEGLRVIARMDINCTNREMYEKYPHWYCRDAKGEVITSQGRYVTCVNGGYYQEFIPEIFREIIGKYHPDGFADNSWAGSGIKTICYCDSCRKKFREKYNLELPVTADWEDPVYRTWVRWNYQIRVDNWIRFNEVTMEAGGENCKWIGMLNADPFMTGGRFYDIKKLLEHSDFVFCDHQSRDSVCGFEQNALNGNLLRMAGKEDMIVAESMAHYYKGLRTFRLAGASKAEVRKWMMTGVAGQISPWYHFVGGTVRDQRRLHLTDDILRLIKENKKYLYHRRNLAKVGVLWNQETAIYYGRDNCYQKSASCFRGYCEVLSRAGIPFIPVHTDDIEKYQDRLELLIAPNVAILTDAQQEKIVDWLKDGKHLILTDETGLYNEDGCFRGTGKLHQFLELLTKDKVYGVEITDKPEDWKVHDAHNYMHITKPEHPVFAKLGDTELVGLGGQLIDIQAEKWEKLCEYVPSFPIYPPEFAWIREDSDCGCIFAREFENGSRVVFFTADLDRCYAMYHIPDHRTILEGAVRYAMSDNRSYICEAPAHVNMNCYRTEDETVIHLVNLAGCNAPLGAQEENIPIGPVRIRLAQNEFWKGRKAVSLFDQNQYAVIEKDNCAYVEIPVLKEQEILVINNHR